MGMLPFKPNKYTDWYQKIIAHATSESRQKCPKTCTEYVYYERHHIIPKSLGGSNDSTNLVLLTGREHVICHLLLTKMCLSTQDERKMVNAYFKMACVGSDHQRIPARLYDWIRARKASLGHSEETKQKLREAWKNRPPISEETRRKMSASLIKSGGNRKPLSEERKRQISEANRNPSPETRDRMSKAQTGRIVSDECKEKLRKINLGKTHSLESIQKMSDAKKGKPKSEETRAKMSEAALRRWHGGITPE